MTKAMNHARLFDMPKDIAVVTGACGRLGPVWIQALLEAGAKVMGLDLPDVPLSQSCLSLQRDYGDRLLFARADMTDQRQLQQARLQCEKQFGSATVLVNNAGIDQPPDAVTSYTLTEWPVRQINDVLAVNVGGVLATTQVFAESMLQQQKGSIINIGSLYARVSPDPRLYDHIACEPPFLKPPAYGASKAALINLTRYLAVHWAGQGIRVNSLSPGGVLANQDVQFQSKYAERVPMGRMAQADDLVGPLVFLACSASSYLTGQDICVDGGFSLW